MMVKLFKKIFILAIFIFASGFFLQNDTYAASVSSNGNIQVNIASDPKKPIPDQKTPSIPNTGLGDFFNRETHIAGHFIKNYILLSVVLSITIFTIAFLIFFHIHSKRRGLNTLFNTRKKEINEQRNKQIQAKVDRFKNEKNIEIVDVNKIIRKHRAKKIVVSSFPPLVFSFLALGAVYIMSPSHAAVNTSISLEAEPIVINAKIGETTEVSGSAKTTVSTGVNTGYALYAQLTSRNLPSGVTVTFDGQDISEKKLIHQNDNGPILPPGEELQHQVVVSVNGNATIQGSFDLEYTVSAEYINIPTITRTDPAYSKINEQQQLTIYGTGFIEGQIPEVKINDINCDSVRVVDDSQLTCVAQSQSFAHNTAVNMSISNEAGAETYNNAYKFIVAPTISAISPNIIRPNTEETITISGEDFRDGTGDAPTIKIGNENCNLVSALDNQIKCKITSSNTGTYDLSVETHGGIATENSGISISAVNPADCSGQFTLNPDMSANCDGTYSPNGPTTQPTSVCNSGVVLITAGGQLSCSPSGTLETTFTNPTTVISGDITITNGNEITCNDSGNCEITLQDGGKIEIDENSEITVNGSGTVHIDNCENNCTISTGDGSTTVSVDDGTTVTSGAGGTVSVDTCVTNQGGAEYCGNPTVVINPGNEVEFPQGGEVNLPNGDTIPVVPGGEVEAGGSGGQALPALTVSSISPEAGALGSATTITFTGTGFEDANRVPLIKQITIGGAECTNLAIQSATSASCQTPQTILAAGQQTVIVTQYGGATDSTKTFTFLDAPTITAVSPITTAISGGETITINGTNFTTIGSGMVVTIGSANCGSVSVISSTELSCTAPANTAGSQALSVSNPGGTASGLNITYFGTPTLSSITPNEGPIDGGTVITIGGTGFNEIEQDKNEVSVGGNDCRVDSASVTEIICEVSAHSAGKVEVSVSVNGQSATQNDWYEFVDTRGVFSLSPLAGPVAGGTTVTITGNLGVTQQSDIQDIKLGGKSVLNIQYDAGNNTITFETPDTDQMTLCPQGAVFNPSYSEYNCNSNQYYNTGGVADIEITTTTDIFTKQYAFNFLSVPLLGPSDHQNSDELAGQFSGPLAGGNKIYIPEHYGSADLLTNTNIVKIDGNILNSCYIEEGTDTNPHTHENIITKKLVCIAPPTTSGPGPKDMTLITAGGEYTYTGLYTYVEPPIVLGIEHQYAIDRRDNNDTSSYEMAENFIYGTNLKIAGDYGTLIHIDNCPNGLQEEDDHGTIYMRDKCYGQIDQVTNDRMEFRPPGLKDNLAINSTHDITVTTKGGTATLANALTYLAPPVITGVSPQLVRENTDGQVVRLTGYNFVNDGSNAYMVNYNNNSSPCIDLIYINSTTLDCTIERESFMPTSQGGLLASTENIEIAYNLPYLSSTLLSGTNGVLYPSTSTGTLGVDAVGYLFVPYVSYIAYDDNGNTLYNTIRQSGGQITIDGSHFIDNYGSIGTTFRGLKIGNYDCENFVIMDSYTATCDAPAMARGNYNLTIIDELGDIYVEPLHVTVRVGDIPTITSISQNYFDGYSGSTDNITITGTGFEQGKTKIKALNENNSEVYEYDENAITVVDENTIIFSVWKWSGSYDRYKLIPTDADFGDGSSSNAEVFFTDPPSTYGISPDSVSKGDEITITLDNGLCFSDGTLAITNVKIGGFMYDDSGQDAQIVGYDCSNNTVRVIVPELPNRGTGRVEVKVYNIAGSAVDSYNLTYIGPTIFIDRTLFTSNINNNYDSDAQHGLNLNANIQKAMNGESNWSSGRASISEELFVDCIGMKGANSITLTNENYETITLSVNPDGTCSGQMSTIDSPNTNTNFTIHGTTDTGISVDSINTMYIDPTTLFEALIYYNNQAGDSINIYLETVQYTGKIKGGTRYTGATNLMEYLYNNGQATATQAWGNARSNFDCSNNRLLPMTGSNIPLWSISPTGPMYFANNDSQPQCEIPADANWDIQILTLDI